MGSPLFPYGGGQTTPPPAPMGAAGGAMPIDGVGMNQVGSSAVQVAMEIDQACKLLAKLVPPMGPMIAEFVTQLRLQLGAALSAGQTGSMTGPDQGFPDGSSRLTA